MIPIDELRVIVSDVVTRMPLGFYRGLLKHHNQINTLPGRTFGEKCYLLIHDTNPTPCRWCGGPSIFDNMPNGYRTACSRKCAAHLGGQAHKENVDQVERVKVMRETNLKQYGVEWNSQRPEIQAKKKETSRKRYGVDHWMQVDEIKQRVIDSTRRTLQERYGEGVTNMMHIPEIVERARAGQHRYAQSEEYKTRIEKLRAYAKTDEYFLQWFPEGVVQDPRSVLDGRCLTNIAIDLDHKSSYMLNALLEAKGIDYSPGITPIVQNRSPEAFAILNDAEMLDSLYDQHQNLDSLRKHLGVDQSTIITFLDKHGLQIGGRSSYGYTASKFEIEVREWITSLGFEVQANTRKVIAPYEIDIFIPELRVGIECDGVYWHGQYHQNYHMMKDLIMLDANVSPLHVSDDEWYRDRESSQLRVKRALGIEPKIKIVGNELDLRRYAEYDVRGEVTGHLFPEVMNEEMGYYDSGKLMIKS